MRSKTFWLILASLVVAAGAALVTYRLAHPARALRHPLTGYVLEVTPEMNRITVRNQDVPGVMVSMVMDYRVKDAAALAEIEPGDVIPATMVADDAYY
jgi:Cu/Ag efflux protein CusF